MMTLKERLKTAGIQPSSPRLAIANYVLATRSHPTAEQVKLEVEKTFPSVSLATVYNTLHLFVEKGLLQAVQDPYQESIRYDPNVKPHFHFIDEETGHMEDLDPRAIRVSPNTQLLGSNYEIREIEVLLKGKKRKP